jgi:hypothetical protein
MTSITEKNRTRPEREARTGERTADIRGKELALGMCNSAMMMAVTKLGVADQIDDEPVALTDLAQDAPESYTVFSRAMSQVSGYTSEAIADIVDLRGATCCARCCGATRMRGGPL